MKPIQKARQARLKAIPEILAASPKTNNIELAARFGLHALKREHLPSEAGSFQRHDDSGSLVHPD